jgi:hypothetical protein
MKSVNHKKMPGILKKFGLKQINDHVDRKHTKYKLGDIEVHLGLHNREHPIKHFWNIFEQLGVEKTEIERFFEDKNFRKQKIKEFKERMNKLK